ncbi:MAG TPA: hypothetical protein VD866_24155, partial [Urbifossiella sp.]|nr:hypothetical protein [Urbifossiella sp.]
FLLKDAVFVIDDFAPSESKHDADRQHRVLERMVRAQGNGSGRGRMTTRNGSRPKMTPARPPRGIIVSTAEDVPKLQSLIARLCVLEVRRGDVNLSRLSSHQRDADEGKYAAAMAGYLAFLAPQYGQVRAGLAAERDQLRDLFVGQLQHARTPTVTADLLLGLRYLLRFAEAVGAVTADQQAALWKRGSAACLAVARGQAEHQMAMDPVAQFPARLASILSSGKGHLAGPDGRTPANSIPPDVWGWAPHENGYQERGPKIGWVDADTIYLDQDAAFAALSSLYLSHGGKTLPFGQETFWKRLKGEGLLTRTEPQKTTYRWHLGGIRRAVAWVRIDTVFPADGSPKAGSVPVSDPSCPCDGGEQGQEKDANCHEKPGFVPAVPVVPAPGGRVPTSQTLLGDDSDGYDEIAR